MARRLWRYKVDEVWGFESYETPPVKVGDELIDRWKADGTWRIIKFKGPDAGKDVGGFHAGLLGKYDGPVDGHGRPVSEAGRG